MHHKFVVIDFDKPTVRVYFGSYNFSSQADVKNGENLLLTKDRRVATSYIVESLRLFDHYHFGTARRQAAIAHAELVRQRPPSKPGEQPLWAADYDNVRKIEDRELFS
jgi:phosphatidylserine/phosphatidylglycerophosphate/cardiolipin synthase-like enzyme